MWNTEVEGVLEIIAHDSNDLDSFKAVYYLNFKISLQKILKKCGIKGERIFPQISDI